MTQLTGALIPTDDLCDRCGQPAERFHRTDDKGRKVEMLYCKRDGWTRRTPYVPEVTKP